MVQQKLRYLLLSLIAIMIIVATVFLVHHHALKHQRALPPVSIKLGNAENLTLPNQIKTTGNIVALQTANVSAKVNGYVTEIFYHEGQHVKKNEVLVKLDDQTERETLAADELKAKMSTLQTNRDSNLLKRGFILQDTQYNDQVTNAQDRAQLAQDITNLNNKTIRAAFDGVVGAKLISIGDYVTAGKTITSLTNTQNLIVKYFVPSQDVDNLKLGQTVTVESNFNHHIKAPGKVTYVAPYIDSNTQTIEVHANVDNKNEQFKPGEFVNVKQDLGAPQTVLAVPASSVLASLKGYYVYTVKNNKAVSVPVTLGAHYQNKIAITSGLKAGDQIVIVGQDQLSKGSTVKVVHP